MLTTSTQIHLPARLYSGQAIALARLMDLMYQYLSDKECDSLAQRDLDETLSALSSADRAESILRDLTDDPNAVVL